ncbi:MAG: chorismate synthase [Ignavibacteriaceae bacterium]|jgi:chorismate synthase|nr:chorismate synthase [Ignavibacteriaceae bacterium]
MIRFLTAGESHGKALVTIVEGFPSNIPISAGEINYQLKRRQGGYGRGTRMKIESDSVQILSGIRFGKTLGSPISFLIENKDWVNWEKELSVQQNKESIKKITIPRPGHADLVGVSKYNFDDIRNSIERSSARETAARMAAGSIARIFLEHFGIKIASYVESIGGIYPSNDYFNQLLKNKTLLLKSGLNISAKADKSAVRVLDESQEKKIINKIKSVKKSGDTLGGTFIAIATGVPVGLGSFMHFDRRLDADIAFHLMSINAVKGVEIGNGFESAEQYGSQVHDEITIDVKNFSRKTNHSGGIEGGISNGLPILVRAAMKPISTLARPLNSIDLTTMKKIISRYERSDFTAVPSCAVVAESMLAWVLAKHFLIKFGGDSLEETEDNFSSFTKKSFDRIRKGFKK